MNITRRRLESKSRVPNAVVRVRVQIKWESESDLCQEDSSSANTVGLSSWDNFTDCSTHNAEMFIGVVFDAESRRSDDVAQTDMTCVASRVIDAGRTIESIFAHLTIDSHRVVLQKYNICHLKFYYRYFSKFTF